MIGRAKITAELVPVDACRTTLNVHYDGGRWDVTIVLAMVAANLAQHEGIPLWEMLDRLELAHQTLTACEQYRVDLKALARAMGLREERGSE